MKERIYLILLLWVLPILSFAQDTISVYFAPDKYSLSDYEKSRLETALTDYNYLEIDSVLVIGMADSTGKFSHNLKLSQKRAEHVTIILKEIFPQQPPIKNKALGAKKEGGNPDKNRRVDVIFYYQKADTVRELSPGIENLCYYIDYKHLSKSHITSITKGKQKYIQLTISHMDFRRDKNVFTGSIAEDGSFETKKLLWTLRTTGAYWWQKPHYQLTLKEGDFNRFKIFDIEAPPCRNCNSEFPSGPVLADSCILEDYSVMRNIQFHKFSLGKSIKARIPKEFIQTTLDYYHAYSDSTIFWQTRKSRKGSLYYYTDFPVESGFIMPIYRKNICCHGDSLKINPEFMIRCLLIKIPDKLFFIEPGSYLQNQQLIPYLSIGFVRSISYFTHTSFLLGATPSHGLIGQARLQLNLFNFPFSDINIFNPWQEPVSFYSLNYVGSLYSGIEYKVNAFSETRISDINIHSGISILSLNNKKLLSRVFLQYGLGYNFINNNETALLGITQVGINLRL